MKPLTIFFVFNTRTSHLMYKELNLLILESKKGNQKAQIKLYDMFCEAMFFISCRYLKNKEEAKDAMQDAFLKAFLNLESYKEDRSFIMNSKYKCF